MSSFTIILGPILISYLCQYFPSDLFPSNSPTEFCVHISLSSSCTNSLSRDVFQHQHCPLQMAVPVQITESVATTGSVELFVSECLYYRLNHLQYYSKKLSIFHLCVVNITNTNGKFPFWALDRCQRHILAFQNCVKSQCLTIVWRAWLPKWT